LYNFPFSFGFNFLACSWNEDKMPHKYPIWYIIMSSMS
jgi:hypothetical protein